MFRFRSLKTVLVINKSCSAHFLRSRRPLLLHLLTPSEPITPSQVWWSVPTLALKSPRRMSLSVRGVAEIILPKALLTPTLQPVRDLFATDFFATDWRSVRLAQPLYAHIRIEDFNRRLVGNRLATGLRLIGDLSP